MAENQVYVFDGGHKRVYGAEIRSKAPDTSRPPQSVYITYKQPKKTSVREAALFRRPGLTRSAHTSPRMSRALSCTSTFHTFERKFQ